MVPGELHLDPGLSALELGLNQANTLIRKKSPLDSLLKLALHSTPSKRNERPGFLRSLLPLLFGPESTGAPIEIGEKTTSTRSTTSGIAGGG